MRTASLAVLLLLACSHFVDAAVCYKSRVSAGTSVATATANTIVSKGLMLWGCTLEGNPWLTYSVVPTTPTNIWVMVGYNFACMNNAVPNLVPDSAIAGTSFNAGNPSSPPVWDKTQVTWPSSYFTPQPSTPSNILACLTRSDTVSPQTFGTTSYDAVSQCTLNTPVQIPAASTPVCLMIVCGSPNSSVGCGFKATVQVGNDANDVMLMSSASMLPTLLSFVTLLLSAVMML